jgi:F0F1-type ATP synthase epsilon subunit
MSESQLILVVRTPRDVVLERGVWSVRVPTETGQVGLRPRVEALVLAVEAGLVLVRRGEKDEYVGTAGGLLRCDGTTASLLTPLAVAGDDVDAVIDALDDALAEPSVELEGRAALERLQASIVRQLREGERQQLRRFEGAP